MRRSIHWQIFNATGGDDALIKFYTQNITSFVELAVQGDMYANDHKGWKVRHGGLPKQIRGTEYQANLFSGNGSGSDTIPMVSEVNTINAIMKWQGYQEQQKVFDSNAIFIFSILNSMTKEAKAIEEANAKMRKHK